MYKLICLIALSLFLIACGTSESPKESENNKPQIENDLSENTPADERLKKLKVEASRLRAGGSIKSVELDNGMVSIEYVKNYEEYKKLQPKSSLTQRELEAYWESGNAIKKALVGGSVRLMRKLDFVNRVKITLPYKRVHYSIDVSKVELEKFLQTDFKSVVDNWDAIFSDPYVYDKKGLRTFFREFGKIN